MFEAAADGLHQADHLPGLVRVEPRHHLVEEEDLGPVREGVGDLHLLGLEHRDLRHAALEAVQAEGVAQRLGLAPGLPLAHAPGEHEADHDILAHVQVRERADELEGPGKTHAGAPVGGQVGDVASLEGDAPGGGRVHAGHQVDERRLARAVGPDDAQYLSPLQAEGDVVHCHEAAKPLGESRRFEGCHQWPPVDGALRRPSGGARRRPSGGARRRPRTRPHRPWGMNRMTSRMMTPYTR